MDEKPKEQQTLEFLHDVKLEISAEFGRSSLTVRKLLALGRGSIIELPKEPSEPLDIRANGKLVARGEVIVVNDRYGVRITELVSPADDDGLNGGQPPKA